MKTQLIEAIAVTFELCGSTTLSAAAKNMMVSELEQYSDEHIVRALKRCRAEVKGRLSLSDIVSRIPGDWPRSDEAWSMCPKSESESAVLCDEISISYYEATQMTEGDNAQRLAFRDIYTDRVNDAKSAGKRPRWYPSLGHDKRGREGALRAAVTKMLLTADHVRKLLQDLDSGANAVNELVSKTPIGELPAKTATEADIDAAIKALPWESDNG